MNKSQNNSIPNEYLCPITLDIMKEPMVMPDGHTYEKEAIKRALELRPFSPLTKQPMQFSDGYINYSLKSLIETFVSEHHISSSDINIDEKLKILHSKQDEITKIEFEELSACYISEETNANIYKDAIHISMKPKKDIPVSPVHLVCVVDTSSSMGMNCCNNNSSEMEKMYLTRIDLIKHSLKTIISILKKEDMISVIEFNSCAKVIVKPTILSLTAEKERVISSIDKMYPTSCTNMWDGLRLGIDISHSIPFKNYTKSILLFTDGHSNVNPPLGVLQTLKNKLKIDNHLNNDLTISTFSFGSDVDSELLVDIANLGNGIYGYCYDSSMVGTTFINYMSNLLSTITPIIKVKVKQGEAAMKSMTIGPLYRGGYRNAIIKIDKSLLDQTEVTIEIPMTQQQFKVPVSSESPNLLSYMDEMSELEKKQDLKQSSLNEGDVNDEDELLDQDSDSDDMDILYEDIDIFKISEKKDSESIVPEENLLNQLIRTKLILTLNTINKMIKSNNQISYEFNNDNAKQVLKEYLELLKGLKYKTKFIKSIIIDIENLDPNHGQVEKAIRPEYYNKWGKCYIDSFLRFHQYEQCGNFKDQSLQYYANDIFTFFRKWAHSVFINLPPPEHHSSNIIGVSSNNNSSTIMFRFGRRSSNSFSNNSSTTSFGFGGRSINSFSNNSSTTSFGFGGRSINSFSNNSSTTSFGFGGRSSNSFSNNSSTTDIGFGERSINSFSNNSSTKGFGFCGNSSNSFSNNNSTRGFTFGGNSSNNFSFNNSTSGFAFGGNSSYSFSNNNSTSGFAFGGNSSNSISNNNSTSGFAFGGNSSYSFSNNNSTSCFGSSNNYTSSKGFGFDGTFKNSSSTSSKINMASFLNPHGGCFDGNAIVLLANGKKKRVKDLKKGDCLNNNAIVHCLIEQNINNKKNNNILCKSYMCDIHGVLFTPYHPVLLNNKWYFPIDLVNANQVTIKSWYNLILEDEINKKYEVEFSNGIKAITLGHYRNDNKILKHPYFGTDLVLKDLKERDPTGYSNGYIYIKDFNPKQLQYDNNHYCINYYKTFSDTESFNHSNNNTQLSKHNMVM